MLTFFKGLGVGLLCLLLFVAGVVFNVEFLGKKSNSNEVELSTSVENSMKLKPDIYETEINFWANENLSAKIHLSDAEKAQISQSFKAILERSAKDNFCAGGTYSLEPNYSYENHFKIPKGHRLNATLNCEIKAENLSAFNAFLSDINELVSKSEFISVSTPALRANFSSEALKGVKEKLNDELLSRAYEYEKSYSAKLNKTCTLKSFSLNSIPPATPRAFVMNARSMADEVVSLPLTKEQSQSATANLLFICK